MAYDAERLLPEIRIRLTVAEAEDVVDALWTLTLVRPVDGVTHLHDKLKALVDEAIALN